MKKLILLVPIIGWLKEKEYFKYGIYPYDNPNEQAFISTVRIFLTALLIVLILK